MNLSGTVLKGRYCILDPVGKGGGGKVYLARDLELGVLWAVKEIPVSDKSEPYAFETFASVFAKDDRLHRR